MKPLLGACVLLATFALGFSVGRSDRFAFAGVVAAAAAGTILGAFVIASYVVVQLTRAADAAAKANHFAQRDI
jgi:hypothetical protein